MVSSPSQSAEHLVDVAPAPRLAGLDVRITGCPVSRKCAVGMPPLRGVAAADVAAGQAEPKVHPRHPGRMALRTALRVRGSTSVVETAPLEVLGRPPRWSPRAAPRCPRRRLVLVVDAVEHRLLEVERASTTAEHLVVGAALVAQPEQASAARPGASVIRTRRYGSLGVSSTSAPRASEPLPHLVDPVLGPSTSAASRVSSSMFVSRVEHGEARAGRRRQHGRGLQGVLSRVGAAHAEAPGEGRQGRPLEEQGARW